MCNHCWQTMKLVMCRIRHLQRQQMPADKQWRQQANRQPTSECFYRKIAFMLASVLILLKKKCNTAMCVYECATNNVRCISALAMKFCCHACHNLFLFLLYWRDNGLTLHAAISAQLLVLKHSVWHNNHWRRGYLLLHFWLQ